MAGRVFDTRKRMAAKGQDRDEQIATRNAEKRRLRAVPMCHYSQGAGSDGVLLKILAPVPMLLSSVVARLEVTDLTAESEVTIRFHKAEGGTVTTAYPLKETISDLRNDDIRLGKEDLLEISVTGCTAGQCCISYTTEQLAK